MLAHGRSKVAVELAMMVALSMFAEHPRWSGIREGSCRVQQLSGNLMRLVLYYCLLYETTHMLGMFYCFESAIYFSGLKPVTILGARMALFLSPFSTFLRTWGSRGGSYSACRLTMFASAASSLAIVGDRLRRR